jgi:hopanoid biosynthesis associated protein HpnK
VRRLIVNADDLGLTSGVNRGILKAHTEGIVTSSTLMACGTQFDEAVELAAAHPDLSVGCHVVLVDGSPMLNPTEVPSLLHNSGPQFCQSILSFAMSAVRGRLNPHQIEAEVIAQIKRLQSAGVRVSHVDSHKHAHMFPVALRAILRAAQKCGIRAIRNPFEPLLFAVSGNWKRQFQLGILSRYRAEFRQELAKTDTATPDGCIGIVATGGLTMANFKALIENLREGTWEFVSHPGYNDADLDRISTRLRASRETELAILTSREIKELIKKAGIQLISYRDLARG